MSVLHDLTDSAAPVRYFCTLFLATALKREPGVEGELVDGDRGELTVLVDGRVVARKGLVFKPSVRKVLAAVRDAAPARANP